MLLAQGHPYSGMSWVIAESESNRLAKRQETEPKVRQCSHKSRRKTRHPKSPLKVLEWPKSLTYASQLSQELHN